MDPPLSIRQCLPAPSSGGADYRSGQAGGIPLGALRTRAEDDSDEYKRWESCAFICCAMFVLIAIRFECAPRYNNLSEGTARAPRTSVGVYSGPGQRPAADFASGPAHTANYWLLNISGFIYILISVLRAPVRTIVLGRARTSASRGRDTCHASHGHAI